ncbi:pyruvate formate-lyase-activating protein [Clostridium felsineum]|uniref:Pyruvate formate-lyase-activating enzyme n=1 Tax=Clostridium felsineum TaxID=36839 RepID=A0A1S8M2U1_9CLOT|nr:pyruvate formate-lyase-activating protein [Clostridium felsineum]URZ01385.1 Pyruvate formate-lyase 1-activating enzyme [Clostridium felsineum]URZ05771.1 Pyruvate formate-lyase 1-activating enzyme [Clostridium felsineum]URZ10810.1 Pyruvate formate-lyase 1-activating enzyme [Clostridium felsineum]
MGKIHSIETMGLVDGPGIRVVVFFAGCRLRCAFCHNPDTWNINSGEEISPEDLLKKVKRYKNYFDRSGGGITCSGGEPLMQPEFLKEFLKLCKENGINTTVDTAGFGCNHYEEILKYTDYVLLDIKHINSEGYKNLTGGDMNEFYKFVSEVNNSKAVVWIRHVMVPGITDNYESMDRLAKIVQKVKRVEKVEILPYHTLGIKKYEKLAIEYKLKGIKDMDKDTASKFEKYVNEKLKK